MESTVTWGVGQGSDAYLIQCSVTKLSNIDRGHTKSYATEYALQDAIHRFVNKPL